MTAPEINVDDDHLSETVDTSSYLLSKSTVIDNKLATSRRRAKFLTVSGLAVAIVVGCLRACLPLIVERVVWDETSITSPDSTLFEAWINPAAVGVNIYRDFTFYNLTNADDVVAGHPPNFVQRGPYVYEEQRVKVRSSVQWFSNGTVGYTYTSTFRFVPEMSIDAITGEQLNDATDVFILPNAPLIGLTHRLSLLPNDLGNISWLPITKQECCILLDLMVNATVGPQGLFVQRSIHELLWGYVDPIWDAVHSTLAYLNYTASRVFRSEWNGTYTVPSPYSFRSGQMCPLWEHNADCNTTTNLYTLEGSGGVRDGPVAMGHLSQWAGQRSLWWWGNETDGYTGGMEMKPTPVRAAPDYDLEELDVECHAVQGSDGLRFGPGLTEDSTPTLFLDMLWRSIPLTYKQAVSVKDVPALSFALDPHALSNETEIGRRCYQAHMFGVLNFSRPLFGPAFATKAGLLDARVDRTDVNFTLQRPECVRFAHQGGPEAAVTCVEWGLSPSRNVLDHLEYYHQRESNPDAFRAEFDSHLDINGLTGVTLRGVARGEAYTKLKPLEVSGCPNLFQTFANLTHTFIPLVNVQRGTEVSDAYAAKLRTALLLLEISTIGMYIAIGFGVGMCIAGLVWLRTLKTVATMMSSSK